MRNFLSIPSFLSFLCHERMWVHGKCFFCIHWGDHLRFLSLYSFTTIYNLDYNPGLSPTSLWYLAFFICCWICFIVLYYGFLCLFIQVLVYNLYFMMSLSGAIKMIIKWVQMCYIPIWGRGRICKESTNSFTTYLPLPIESTRPGLFFVRIF